jgi:hypothetical protein
MTPTTLFTIIIIAIIINILFTRSVGNMLNRVGAMAHNNAQNIKRIDNNVIKIHDISAFNIDNISVMIKYVYNNGTNEERKEIERIIKKYKSTIKCNIKYTS